MFYLQKKCLLLALCDQGARSLQGQEDRALGKLLKCTAVRLVEPHRLKQKPYMPGGIWWLCFSKKKSKKLAQLLHNAVKGSFFYAIVLSEYGKYSFTFHTCTLPVHQKYNILPKSNNVCFTQLYLLHQNSSHFTAHPVCPSPQSLCSNIIWFLLVSATMNVRTVTLTVGGRRGKQLAGPCEKQTLHSVSPPSLHLL